MQKILSHFSTTKFFFMWATCTSIMFTSCDEASVVGLDVQPETDLLNVFYKDTATIHTRTVKEDSLKTNPNTIGVLGKYLDPVFGELNASLYRQLKLNVTIKITDSINNISQFGKNPICDSVILVLHYDTTTFYGKTTFSPQKVSVYEVSENLSTSATYYSNQNLSKYATDLTAADGYTFTPKPKEKLLIDGKQVAPQLRIPLDISFGQTILNRPTIDKTTLSSNTNFQNFFKGVYITTEASNVTSGEGNILNLQMQNSAVTIYYHYTGRNKNNTSDSTYRVNYSFTFKDVAGFNHFAHDYTKAIPDIQTQLANPSQKQNDVVYTQGMAGLKTKIQFPYIMNWVDSGAIGINKAELIIKLDSDSANAIGDFAPPEKFFLWSIQDDGTSFPLPDYNAVYFGGTYDAANKEFKFNITRYIQQILSKQRNNNGLYLVSYYPLTTANRAVISGGSATSTKPMKLNITYTKIH